jgi:uncharacterized membrane protein YvbJ
MTITRQQALDAAFWDRALCIECGAEHEKGHEDSCEECGTESSVFDAQGIVQVLEAIVEDTE